MAGEEDVLTASIDVSREEVENYNNQHGGNDFYCQCYARYAVPDMTDPQYLASAKGYVQVGCTYCAVLLCVGLGCIVLCCVVLCCVVLYCIVMYCVALVGKPISNVNTELL